MVRATLLGSLLLAVTACGGGGSDSGAASGGKDAEGAKNASPQAVVTIAPKDGADRVATTGALKVAAAKGKLTEVSVEDAKGHEVEGKITGGGPAGSLPSTWPPTPATPSARSPRTPADAARHRSPASPR